MPTWTDPQTWVTGDLVDADALNTYLRDNLLYLKAANSLTSVSVDATYTTSLTTWADVDTAALVITLNAGGGPLLIGARMAVQHVNNLDATQFDVTLDSVRLGGTYGLAHHEAANTWAGQQLPVTFQTMLPDITPGAHTFRLQWRKAGTNPVTLVNTAGGGLPVHFYIMEFSS